VYTSEGGERERPCTLKSHITEGKQREEAEKALNRISGGKRTHRIQKKEEGSTESSPRVLSGKVVRESKNQNRANKKREGKKKVKFVTET